LSLEYWIARSKPGDDSVFVAVALALLIGIGGSSHRPDFGANRTPKAATRGRILLLSGQKQPKTAISNKKDHHETR
jgi:hypothetical protein